jgi:hypothetical protein
MQTTETIIGNMVFNTKEEAESFIIGMMEMADDEETFEIHPYQGNRFHVARLYCGQFEDWC